MAKLRDYIYENIKIKASTIIDLDEFYKRLWRWFVNNGYGKPYETDYREFDQGGGVQNLEIRWECTKDVDHYTKMVIVIDMFFVGLKEAEIEKGGVKTKLIKGTYEFRITAYVEKEGFSGSWMMDKMQEVYDKFVARKRLDKYSKECKVEADQLIAEMKTFMGLYGALF
ncbi:MAG: hypothetical protein Q7R96_05330 [Nanoarchaeota archaeon]|nr:hypothetical protein [Nanoarchaeota archaeon]